MRAIRNKKVIFVVICLILTGFLCASVYAYYTDYHQTNNAFTVGKVKIELQEPLYNLPENEEKRDEMAAGDSFVKDPAVTNTGSSDCYVFVELEIPRSNRLFIDENGQRLPEEYRDIFEFEFNKQWEMLKSDVNNSTSKYILAYAQDKNMTALPKGAKTETVFKNNKVALANIIEIADKETLNIPVKAYAIQTTDLIGTDGKGTDNPEQIFNLIKNQLKSEEEGKDGNK